jgi:hypothetical protein
MLDACFVNTTEYLTLVEQGHSIKIMGTEGVDLIISPIAQMTPRTRLGYVVKKLKEIVKEVSSK